jgi:tRNA A-37 threonylcarbamoyl transferase component Bud32/tetratricopeptide (TPR) repeat protein
MIGTQIANYRIEGKIGEGGMGVVYMAEQERPVRRRVALKIIKPGMDSAQVIARFEAERQALAMMDHPNIARVLDAGTTDTHRPYFVMELVQGIPITKYCDDKQLDTHARLELFIQVCNAVQHAHQKGIIHRDLKPSNVLIAIYDGKPVPKIIDFGVAKALHQRLTEKTMFTQFGAVVGTLEYMSPEQADMDLMGTDTRSDIYSLGVLLYELLTGSTPLDGKKLRSLGYAEMLKTIRDSDPPKPSTRLSQSREKMGTISARRHTEPKRLQKMIAGDLDWIVMKCLEKDRTRRYETANGLAIDIQRHLQDEAVSASPPGQLYKFQKLVRRNRLVFAAIGAVMLALVIGLAASLWEAGRAAREAELASREAELARSAEHQALTTLDELSATAPTFAAEARALAGKGQFDEAIQKLNYAVKLQPGAPEYLVAKGDLYLCQLKLRLATAIYHDVLRLKPDFAPAEMKANLCDQLLAAAGSAQGKLNLESLVKIYSALEPEKRSDAELNAVKEAYTDQKERLWNYWLPRLQSLPMFANIPLDVSPQVTNRFNVRDDGQLILYLDGMDPGDLSQIKDLPVADIYLSNSLNVTDVRPLADMPGLENVTVPPLARNIEALRQLPKLNRLSFSMTQQPGLSADQQNLIGEASTSLNPIKSLRRLMLFDINGPWGYPTPATTADEFWKEYSSLAALARIRDSAIQPNGIFRLTDGTWYVDFSDKSQFTDAGLLRGMPISSLVLGNTSVADLSPLRGMPLKVLYVNDTKVSDLTPIKDLPLKLLNIARTNITDIAVVHGLPLIDLTLDGLPLKDISALRGMPLTHRLRFSQCGNLTDLSPLADCKGITELVLPPNFTDFQFLHNLPKLQRVSFVGPGSNDYAPDMTVEQFWASIDHQKAPPWLAALHESKLAYSAHQFADGTWQLILDNQPIADLSRFNGAPISQLSISGTRVADLSPLRGMKLTVLRFAGTKVVDLSPLQGMPITSMALAGTQVRDLTPLIGMPLQSLSLPWCFQITDVSPLVSTYGTLEKLVLPPNAKEIGFLRHFPNLKRISYVYNARIRGPATSAAQFWADYDKSRTTATTRP